MEQPAISSDLIRGHIDTIILHSLIDGDKFPQQISDFIDSKSDNQYQIVQATLYSSLKRLESLNYVKSYWNDSENGRRKYYNITAKGEDLVKSNLSSWSYSRSIIDKLMDLESSPVVKTEYIIKEIVKEVPNEVKVEVPVAVTENTTKPNVETSNLEEKTHIFVPINQEDNDINFRSVLKGLIKFKENAPNIDENLSEQKVEKTNEVLEPIKKSDEVDASQQKIGFNESIEKTAVPTNKLKISGKIDFTDLVTKAEQEGYKLKVSSNEPINIGKIYKNRLNFVSSILIFALTVLEIVFISLKYGVTTGISQNVAIISSAVMLIFPIIMGVVWFRNRNKASGKIGGDGMLISAIIAFNLFLITFAVNLIANVDFEDLSVIMFSVILPIVCFADVFCYYLIQFSLSKVRLFKVRF